MSNHAKHFVEGETSEGAVTKGQRRKAAAALDRHIEKRPGCASGDACVHPGFFWTTVYCTHCNRSI